MPAREQIQYLTFSLTQGNIDSFIGAEISTGLIPADGMALDLVSIEMDISSTTLAGVGKAYFDLELTKNPETQLLGLDDPDNLVSIASRLFTTSSAAGTGFMTFPLKKVITEELLVVSSTVNLGFDSLNFSNPLTVTGRIGYTTKKMKEVDILRILQG